MENTNKELEVLRDEALRLYDNTAQCLTILQNGAGHPLMSQYLKRLIPRLKKMYQPFGWVEYKPAMVWPNDIAYFVIHNYSFNTYRWAVDKGFESYITDTNIRIPLEELNEQEIKLLMEKTNERHGYNS